MDSVKTQIGMLSMLSSETDEISRETGVIWRFKKLKVLIALNRIILLYLNKDVIMNQCIRLSQSFAIFSNSRPVKEVKLATVGIVSILGNLKSVS